MKKIKTHSYLLSIFFALTLLIQCDKVNKPVNEDLPLVKRELLKNDAEFEKQVKELLQSVSENQSSKILQNKFDSLTTTYKKMEWAVEYFLPNSARFINGPALPEIEMEEHTVIDAEGLQVLEELFYPTYQPKNKEETIRQLKLLLNKTGTIKTNFEAITMNKAQVFDALREEIFRIASLGLSGFDTPISKNNLKIMPFSLESLMVVINQISTKTNTQELNTEIQKAIGILHQNPDKNTFDYAAFISQHLNKIASLLLDFKRSEQIKDINVITALQKDASTFFSKNAFNVNAFVPGKEYEYSNEKANLGKELFYDNILSSNNDRSCITCHIPEKAFTDGLEKSLALSGSKLPRNTPSLNYSALQHGQFWDMRREDLEGQSSDVISNQEEMHGNLTDIIFKINHDPKYQSAFEKIYKKPTVETWQLQNVLASYIRSLPTFNSDFDEFMRGKSTALTENQKQGFNLFVGKANCAACHFIPLFNGTVPPHFGKTEQEVLGISENSKSIKLDKDLGRGKFHETVVFLQRSFKTPTLRNISKTAPYMHNGGYKTLKEVMDFYNKGGGKGLGLTIENQTLPAEKLQLTNSEIDKIIDFLKSLDDQ